jgi:hypothetical protein
MHLTESKVAVATSTSYCDRAIPLLTAADAVGDNAHRYFAELASDELELDSDEIPVPKEYQTIDLLVASKSEKAIRDLIATADWLEGYTLIRWWQPTDCDCF